MLSIPVLDNADVVFKRRSKHPAADVEMRHGLNDLAGAYFGENKLAFEIPPSQDGEQLKASENAMLSIPVLDNADAVFKRQSKHPAADVERTRKLNDQADECFGQNELTFDVAE